MTVKAGKTAVTTQPALQATPRQRWLRTLAFLTMALLALLFFGWLSFPAWAPSLAVRLAPGDWNLTTLKTGRPGLRGLPVERLNARGQIAGFPLEVTVRDLFLSYRGPSASIEDLRIAVLLPENETGPAPALESLPSLPRLVLPAGLPAVQIESLELLDRRTTAGASYRFSDLSLDGKGDGLTLRVELASPPPLVKDVSLALAVTGQRLLLTLTDPAAGVTPMLRFEQAVDPERPERALGALVWELDLATLNPAALPAVFGAEPLNRLSGRFTGAAAFSGTERLVLESGQLQVEALSGAGPGAEFTGAALLDLVVEQAGLKVTLEAPSLALELAPPRDPVLPAAMRGLLDETAPLALEFQTPAGPEDSPLSLRFAPAGERSFDVAGSARWRFTQGELMTLAGTLRELAAQGNLEPGFTLSEAAGELDGDVSFTYPLSLSFDDRLVGASVGRAAFALAGTALGADRNLAGSINGADFTGFSYSDASTAMSLASLQVNGDVALDAGLRFTGPVEATQAVIATDQQPLAPPLLTAQSLAATLDVRIAPAEDAVESAASLDALVELFGVAAPVAESAADRITLRTDQLDLGTLSGPLGLTTGGLSTGLGGTQRRGMDLDLNGTLLSGATYEGGGELLLGYQAALPFAFRLEPAPGRGRLTFEQAELGPAALAALEGPLAIAFPQALRFEEGMITVDGEAAWSEAGPRGDLLLTARDLGLSLGDTRVESLNLQTRLSLEDVLSGTGELQVAQTRLAAGLEVIALETSITVDGVDRFALEGLQAELLSGFIAAPALRLVEGRLQDSELSWNGLDLQRLLAFLDLDGLDGTGLLDATIPLIAEAGGLAVRDGQFAARGPGRLRYSSGMPASNIGLMALENFEYDTLSGTLNYGSDGSYAITVDLLGRNPDLYGGHPIRFRLNLGGAMPALFRSLFVTGDFEKGIIDRLRTDNPAVLPDL